MDWKPPKLVGLLVGLLVVLTLVSTSLLLIQSMLNQEVGMSLYYTVLLLMLNLVVLGSKLYRCHDLLTLRYHLDRDALSIVCATGRHVVPLDAISRLAPAHELSLREFDGGGWPGYSWGRMPLGAQGVLQVHATQPPRQQLVAVTDQGCYVISPHDPEEFLQDLALRRDLGVIRRPEQRWERTGLASWPIWRDRGFWFVVLFALGLNVALFGFIVSQYPSLPERIPLSLHVQGLVERIASREFLLAIPAVGTAVLFINTLLGMVFHRHERLGALLLAFTVLGVQPLLWLAVSGMLPR